MKTLDAIACPGDGDELRRWAQTRSATLTLDFAKDAGPMEMNHIALGQGGLSPDPIWHSRVAEVRALHPR